MEAAIFYASKDYLGLHGRLKNGAKRAWRNYYFGWDCSRWPRYGACVAEYGSCDISRLACCAQGFAYQPPGSACAWSACWVSGWQNRAIL